MLEAASVVLQQLALNAAHALLEPRAQYALQAIQVQLVLPVLSAIMLAQDQDPL